VIRFTKVEKIEDDAILTAPPSENKENTLESCENVTGKFLCVARLKCNWRKMLQFFGF